MPELSRSDYAVVMKVFGFDDLDTFLDFLADQGRQRPIYDDPDEDARMAAAVARGHQEAEERRLARNRKLSEIAKERHRKKGRDGLQHQPDDSQRRTRVS
jgi:hypothetical protein